jgi:hypothetical protein
VFGLGTFGLGLGLAAFSSDLFGHASFGSDTYSRSLVGHRALVGLLGRTGLVVVQGRNPQRLEANPRFPLLSLEPGLAARESGRWADADEERRATRLFTGALAAGAPVVLALSKREVRPALEFAGWIASEELVPLTAAARPLHLLGLALEAGDGPERGSEATGPGLVRVEMPAACRAEPLGLAEARVEPDGPLQLLETHADLEPLVTCEGGVLIGQLRRGPQPPAVIVADPDLFNNRGLARGDHAALVRGLLVERLGAEGVVIDETLHGHESDQSLMARALGFPLGLVSAHAALWLLLAGLWLSSRFGGVRAPPPPLPPGKALLIENTALLLHAGSSHRAALRRYLQGVLQELGRRTGATGQASETDLLERLGALGRARGVALDPLALTRAARDPELGALEALRLARRIHGWRAALLGQTARNDTRTRSGRR